MSPNHNSRYHKENFKRYIFWPCLIVLLIGPFPKRINGENGRRHFEDVYGRKYGMALTLDVFLPATENGCGIIFVVNGGWFSSHDRMDMVHVDPGDYTPFLSNGYVVFAVVTSSQPKFIIPEQIADMHRAVRFIRYNATRYGVQPNCLGITGASSGGELALMIATQGGPGPADAKDPINRGSSAVQAAAVFFPPTDFLNWGAAGVNGVGVGSMAPLKAAFGPLANTPSGRETLGKEISPIYYLTSNLPPTLIIHGSADQVVPIQQSYEFIKKAGSLHVRAVKLLVRKGKGHGWGDFWKSSEDIQAIVGWFNTYLPRKQARRPGNEQ
jgi:acetyl esterase/lipase